jgi:AraC family cel operon transcriptional repressor
MHRLYLQNILVGDAVCHFVTQRLTARKCVGMHDHDFAEIFWVLQGDGMHWINDQHTFPVNRTEPLRCINLAFAMQAWRFLHKRYYPARKDFFNDRPVEEREYHLLEPQRAEVHRAAMALQAGSRSLLTLERFILNLLHILEPDVAGSADVRLPAWLVQACHEMADPKYFHDGTRTLARLAGRSPEHVAREVRRLLGVTPTDLVNQARMNYAASRLAGSDDTITDIAMDCGFQKLGYFYTLFHRTFGIPPRQYRMREKHIVVPGD